MRRSLLVVFVIVGAIPLLFFAALHFAQLPEVTFEEALRLVAAQPSEERAPKVMVRGMVHALPQPGQVSPTFWMQDRQGRVFAVEYTGGEALPVLQVGQGVVVVGHAHGGTSPYFHASEVRQE